MTNTTQSPETIGKELSKSIAAIIFREYHRKRKAISPENVIAEAMKEVGMP